MPFGQPGQASAIGNAMQGMQKRKPAPLGSMGPRPMNKGIGPSKPLINTPPEGPATQGYGKAALAPSPSMNKLQPTGGVQSGALTEVGSGGSMNPNSGMMPGMARRAFGNMGRPGMAFNPATQLEQTAPPPGFDRPMNPSNPWQNLAQNMGPILQAYRNRGMGQGQDMSWMDQPGAIQTGPSPMEQQIMASKPEAMANMGAVSVPDIIRNEPMEQTPIGPSPEVMPQMSRLRDRFTRRR